MEYAFVRRKGGAKKIKFGDLEKEVEGLAASLDKVFDVESCMIRKCKFMVKPTPESGHRHEIVLDDLFVKYDMKALHDFVAYYISPSRSGELYSKEQIERFLLKWVVQYTGCQVAQF